MAEKTTPGTGSVSLGSESSTDRFCQPESTSPQNRSESQIDVDLLATKLARLCGFDVGSVRVKLCFLPLARVEDGTDFIELTPAQSKRVVELLEKLRDLRVGR